MWTLRGLPKVSMSMTSKMISVSIPDEMLPVVDAAARKEHRSRSELIREALRRYLSREPERMLPLDEARPDEVEAIKRGRAQFGRGEFVRLDDLQRELGLTAR
jgi:metal-responsive CopG/Arc/MetJ family transcriptional regulator